MNHLKAIREPAPAFLCTTALEDFWDTSKQLLFLSKGCLRHSRKSIWLPLNGTVMESPWIDKQKLSESYNYVMAIYERLFPLIAESLNSMHGKKWSERYWRIVIGPWLLFYLHTVYERYVSLTYAFEKYPDLSTIGLSEKSFITPSDTLEFISLVYSDPYNLQLYTNILSAIGKKFPRKELGFKPDLMLGLCIKENNEKPLKSFLRSIYCLLEKKALRTDSIVLKQSYFTRVMEAQFFLKTLGKVNINAVSRIDLPRFNPDPQTRRMVAEKLPTHNEFEAVLLKIMPSDIPLCFIEGYTTMREEIRIKYFFKPKAIFSANSWYYDEGFKCWAAECSEYGTILLGSQHGGVFGTNRYALTEEHERKITDFYYTWGWSENNSKERLLPLPASYLSGRKQIVADKKMDDILYPTIIEPRFSYLLPYTTDYLIKYLEWQNMFISSIYPELHKVLRIRVFNNDMGWDTVQGIKDCFPDVRIEYIHERSFEESLKNCRLYVTDYLGTTYLEALSANKPTILFHDRQMIYNEWRPEAQSYYNNLQSVGILYDSPQAAACAVNTVYNDVEEWWNKPERQAVRKRFCDRFVRTSPNALREWTEEFKRIAGLQRELRSDVTKH